MKLRANGQVNDDIDLDDMDYDEGMGPLGLLIFGARIFKTALLIGSVVSYPK